jgi:altronate dehydratase
MKKNNFIYLLVCSVFLGCNDQKIRFSPEEQEHIDTTFFKKKAILSAQMDSFCLKSTDKFIDKAKDSIMVLRMKDIERLQKIDTLK